MLIRPPTSSPLTGLFARLADASTQLSGSPAWIIVLAIFAITTMADRLTGPQVNFVPIYLLTAALGSWWLGEKGGFAIGLAGIFTAGAINGFNTFSYTPELVSATTVTAWNVGWRIISMGLLVVLASGLRCALDEARWSAATDGLTGVLNKSAFTRRLRGLVTQAQPRGDALVVAYIDLDGFKGVNDGFGHAAGDRLLCQFAEAAVDAIRAHDLFARIGGDEFIALLTVPSCTHGDIAAERLHDRLTRILRNTGHDVTCSVGAVVLESRQVTQPEKLVEAADGLMYEVKRSGKNALRIARVDLQPEAQREPFTPLPDRRKQPPRLIQSAA